MPAMTSRQHWDRVYATKAPAEVSWYRAHLDVSLRLITSANPERSARIIDVGGGESTLPADLLRLGYRDVTVLDLSGKAIAVAREQMGADAGRVRWWQGDVTAYPFKPYAFDVWHDRAAFHFMTQPEERVAYVRQVVRAVRPDGHVIVGAFGPEGPSKCSGLDVVRYDAEALHHTFGRAFRLVEHTTEAHRTPSGTIQQFVYCHCNVIRPDSGAST
jgi:SAM-dependent methyltransferase